MQEVRRELRERMRHILAYLRMLRFIEQAGGGVSIHGRTTGALPIKQDTIHVLKAGVFLHLYNLVESTVTTALEDIAERIKFTNLAFRDLEDCWRRAWAASFAKLDEDLGTDRRLSAALSLCQAVADGIKIEIRPKVGVGNLDDRRIEDLAKRYGINLAIRPSVMNKIKYRVYNDQGFLGLIRIRRNGLAHGHESFADVGKDQSTSDLVRWSWATYQYLKELLASFEAYADAQQYRREAS